MGNRVLKLHGCSGAGKTTVMRSYMQSADRMHEITLDGAKRPEAYVLEFDEWKDDPVIILGSYKNNCGGMDSFPSDAPSIIKAIEHYRELGHVMFEGLLLSTYFGAVGKYMDSLGDDAIFAFMDTPIITCLERVTHRRDVQQSKNKFNPQNTIDKYNTIEHLKNKCVQNGHRVVTIKHDQDPVVQLNVLLRNAA